MASSKRPPNWEEIKTRYIVHGERLRDIAPDYDIALQTIKNRATAERWHKEQVKVGDEIREACKENLKAEMTELYHTSIRVHLKFLQEIEKGIDRQVEIEKNPYYLTAMKNSIRLMLPSVKSDDKSLIDQEPPGFIVTSDAES